jgi:gamma-glutamyltranspeptidase / glutathione hydrolase
MRLARRPSLTVGILAALTALATAVVAVPPAEAIPRHPDKHATATGFGGAVASLDPHGSQAGLEILRRGGNAVDAAVAAAAMLGVTRPYDGSIGGGGFMVVYSADTGEVTTIDARETAPAAMEPDAFIDPATGQPIPFLERRVSGLGVGVPGLVRGWEVALEEFGTMPLHRLLQPAITVAQRGFTADEEYARRTEQNLDIFRDFTSTTDTFLVDGAAPEAGSTVRNRDLAHTYKLLARQGADVFYEGEIAEAIVAAVTDPPLAPGTERNVRPGDMALDDLADYRAPLREPTEVSYRGFEVFGMGPPSSGGSTVGEALNILEGFDLGGVPREEALHLYIEATALAFADRGAYLGDSDFIDVPLQGLLSKEFAAERRALIGEDALSKPVPAGDPFPFDEGAGSAATTTAAADEGSTTHVTVADRQGNVVSYTFTIEQIGGSGITVPGYGFLLNNELTDFETQTGLPNSPEGGKRPRSSMSPTIVLADGALTIKNWEYCVGIDYLHPDAKQIAQSCYLIVLDNDHPRYVGSYKDTWWDRQDVYRSKTGLNYFSHDQAYNIRDAIKAGHVATLWVVIDPVVALPNGIQLNCSRSIEQIVTLRLAANGFPLWNAKKDQIPLKPGKKFSDLFD